MHICKEKTPTITQNAVLLFACSSTSDNPVKTVYLNLQLKLKPRTDMYLQTQLPTVTEVEIP